MKLTLARSDLHPALSDVQRIVERRNTIPILSNVLLVADERGVLHDAHRIFWSIISWRPPGAAVGRARAICH